MKTTVAVAALAVLLNAGCASVSSNWGNPPERFARAAKGQSEAEVRAALGRPSRDMWLRGEQRQGWGYKYTGFYQYRMFWVEFGADGKVAAISDERDYAPPSIYVTR